MALKIRIRLSAISRLGSTLLGLCLLAALGCALYLRFLGNPPVFDDILLVSGSRHAEFASSPFGLALRQPAYFSLALVQVLWGTLQAHRLVSLFFHVACGFALYFAIRELHKCSTVEAPSAKPAAFVAAGLFLAHPVAVYGAGYLVQRSTVLATCFSLFSIALYIRGLREGRYADAISAGLLFSVAVLSKEHAILVPLAAAAGLLLLRSRTAFKLRYTALYVAVCAPAAVLVALLQKGIVGRAYEHQFGAVAAQITDVQFAGFVQSPWIGSMITQAGLFFRYLLLWLWPQTERMAIDLRIDFSATWAPGLAIGACVGFLLFGVAAIRLLLRGGPLGVVGFGLSYVWVLFLLEFAVVRFQEPFVLYRSYLWAPGLAIAVSVALARLPLRTILVIGSVAGSLLMVQANDRLKTFASGVALWEDAVHKLPARPAPGGWRTLYQAGREYLYANEPGKAVAVIDRCLADYSREPHCLLARASIEMHLEQYEEALPYLTNLLAAQPRHGDARHHLGLVLEELGCRDQAREHYQIAAKLGSRVARWRLESLDNPESARNALVSSPRTIRRAGPCQVAPTRFHVPRPD